MAKAILKLLNIPKDTETLVNKSMFKTMKNDIYCF
jgi:hypothetical protein